jgi:hypothetical protein
MNSNLVVGGIDFAPRGLKVGGIGFSADAYEAPPPPTPTGSMAATESGLDIASAFGSVSSVNASTGNFFMFF